MDYEIKPGLVIQIDEQDVPLLVGPTWQFYGKKVFRRVYQDGKPKTQLLHRLIMNPPADMVVDHIDRNPLNNSRENLRICTNRENSCNRAPKPGKSSLFKGVYWDKWVNKWTANISYQKKTKYLGAFDNEQLAAHAYNKAAVVIHGEFARLNPVGIGKE